MLHRIRARARHVLIVSLGLNRLDEEFFSLIADGFFLQDVVLLFYKEPPDAQQHHTIILEGLETPSKSPPLMEGSSIFIDQ